MIKCLICGKGNGIEALYRVFKKLEISAEIKILEDIFQIEYNGNCIDLGHLRKMEYMPEHYFTHKKITEKRDFLGLILGLSYGRDAIKEDMIDIPVLNVSTSGQDLFYDSCALREVNQRIYRSCVQQGRQWKRIVRNQRVVSLHIIIKKCGKSIS